MNSKQREAHDQLVSVIIGAYEDGDITLADIDRDGERIYHDYYDRAVTRGSDWQNWPFMRNCVLSTVRDRLAARLLDFPEDPRSEEMTDLEREKAALEKQIAEHRAEIEKWRSRAAAKKSPAGEDDRAILDCLKRHADAEKNRFIAGLILWRESGKLWSMNQRWHARRIAGFQN